METGLGPVLDIIDRTTTRRDVPRFLSVLFYQSRTYRHFHVASAPGRLNSLKIHSNLHAADDCCRIATKIRDLQLPTAHAASFSQDLELQEYDTSPPHSPLPVEALGSPTKAPSSVEPVTNNILQEDPVNAEVGETSGDEDSYFDVPEEAPSTNQDLPSQVRVAP